MNVESKYFCELAHCFLTGEKVQPLPANLNLEELYQLLDDHDVLSTFAPVLNQADLPELFSQRMQGATLKAGQQNTIMLLELTRFLEKLEDAHCRPIVLKGAGLAQSIYASIDQRYFTDLDVLVPLANVEKSRAILEELGYVPYDTIDLIEFYAQHHFHLVLRSPAGIIVEIHWDLLPSDSNYQFNLDRLADRIQTIETPNGPIHIPSWTDQLVHCVSQIMADQFSGMRRIIDVAKILPLVTDQANLVKEAREQNMATGLWAVLSLVEELTGTEVSPDLMASLRPSDFVVKCFDVVELPEYFLEKKSQKKNWLSKLPEWLCLPGPEPVTKEIARYLIPRTQDYVYYGYDYLNPPAWPQRIRISLGHLYNLAGLTINLTWKLMKNSISPKKETS